jgi:hypothetical protein
MSTAGLGLTLFWKRVRKNPQYLISAVPGHGKCLKNVGWCQKHCQRHTDSLLPLGVFSTASHCSPQKVSVSLTYNSL